MLRAAGVPYCIENVEEAKATLGETVPDIAATQTVDTWQAPV
jgi:hypothetical protein